MLPALGETLEGNAEAPAARNVVPVWYARPSIVHLPGRKLMLVGRVASDVGNGQPEAHIWNADDDSWTPAGALKRGDWFHARALRLPSGRVIYVGIDSLRMLQCAAWDAGTYTWSDCGSIKLKYTSEWDLEPGLLPDGRAFVFVNDHEAAVLDEASNTWTSWTVEWNTKGLTYGAPIHPKQPLARIRDEESGASFELNDAAARFWQTMSGMGSISLLWDAKANLWAYIFLHRTMGRDAQWLPDGCAMSTNPLAVYNPLDASVTPLPDPGFGIHPSMKEMVVMEDATVVVAGPPDGTAGTGFFRRKASCEGFVPGKGSDANASPDLAKPVPPSAASPAAAEPPPSRWQRIRDLTRKYKWLGLACVVLPFAYLALRHVRQSRVEGGWSWGLRVLIYGSLLAILWPALSPLLRGSVQTLVTGSPGIPCKMVGVWSSRQGNVMRRIELKDDGTYVMAPSHLGIDPPGGYTGTWAVQGDTMVWHNNQGTREPDINPMQRLSDQHFRLRENSGRHTDFELIRAIPSSRCSL
jgi:hypothetical protein